MAKIKDLVIATIVVDHCVKKNPTPSIN